MKSFPSFLYFLSLFFYFYQGIDGQQPPVLPLIFSDPNTTLIVSLQQNSTLFYLNGYMYYNASLPANTIIGATSVGNLFVNTTQLSLAHSAYEITNNVCRPGFSGNAGNYFGWLQDSTFSANYDFEGRQCSLWTLSVPQSSLEICIDQDNKPVFFSVTAFDPKLNSTLNVTFYWSEEWNSDSFDQSIFTPPVGCFSNGTTCNNDTVVVLDAYLFHEPNDFTLVNTNVADLLGDVVFVCIAEETKAFTYFQWISHWQIQVNASYGQYALCNFGQCDGGNDILVGQEASFGVSPYGGQCKSNTNYGNWFSLPVQGLCGDNQEIGDNGCSWKPLQRVKTINGSCLFENGFANACDKDGGFPYSSAYQLYFDAFLYDDPSKGGCPSIALELPKKNDNFKSQEYDIKMMVSKLLGFVENLSN